jgi:excinuclease ABC subunit C
LRDDKRFAYIWISSADEVPGVFVVRQVNKPGQYFGPFVSGSAVKETVKVLRKIWPYCTTRKLAKQPCFYYQIGRCAGACGSIISREEYLARVIKPIITFLSGEKKKVIRNYELRIKELNKKIKKSASLERESLELELNQAVYELKNMQQVLENSRVLSTAEKFSTDTVELAKVLGLAKIPARIEGYDTSNIFGHQAVASMVTFVDGEADKSGYRKFKLQIPPQADAPRAQQNSKLKTPFSDSKHGDVQFLQEVLTRRLAHAFPTEDKVSEYWPLPDLMIIDGGKAQLNIALKMLKKYQVDLPVIAISKGGGLRSSIARDKIFISGLSAPIELSLNSPALHLVKRVRDESHRFAISFHRDLRSKKFLGKK